MEWIFRNQETVAARSKYIHQLSSSNNVHPIEYFVYCSMGTVKFELLSWFSIVRDFWRQHFSVLSQKTNNISVVSSHFHLYLRISALRLPTVSLCHKELILWALMIISGLFDSIVCYSRYFWYIFIINTHLPASYSSPFKLLMRTFKVYHWAINKRRELVHSAN